MVEIKDMETEAVKEAVKKESGVTLTDKEAHTLKEALKEKK